MFRTLRPFLFALAAALALAIAPAGLAPAAALAQDHDTHAAHDDHAGGHAAASPTVIPPPQEGVAPLVTALVVFGIVFFVLNRAVWPKIVSGLRDREEKIRAEIAAAEAARKQAKDALEMYERSLADARAESQRMLEQTKAQQQALAAELRTKAEAELVELKERARRDIETAKRNAIIEIQDQAVALGIAAAGRILQRQITPQDQQRILDETLEALQSAGR